MLVYVAVFLYGLSFWNLPLHDPDLGWHLLGGSWIVSHHAVPTQDMINAFNGTWVDYHWLAQVLFFGLYKVGGYELLAIFLGILCSYLAIVLVDIIYLARGRYAPAFPVFLLFAFSISCINEVTSIRPQALSLLIVALTIRRLIQNASKWEPYYILALCTLCVNVHVYWVCIPGLWFLLRCVPSFYNHKGAQKKGLLWFFILLSSGFISPYGVLGDTSAFPAGIFTNYALILDYVFGSNELRTYINELKSTLASATILPGLMLLCTAVSAYSLCLRRKNIRWPNLLVAALFFILAARTLKFVALFAVCSLPFLAQSTVFLTLKKIPLKLRRRITEGTLGAVATYSLVLVIFGSPYLQHRGDDIAKFHPIDACKFIAHLHPPIGSDHTSLRVLTYFDYGGWCRWAMYQEDPTLDVRVTTDGRTQFVPFEHYQLSFDLYKLQYDWMNTLSRWSPDVALVQKRFALAQFMLMASNQWKLVFQDETFAVFVPIRQPLVSK